MAEASCSDVLEAQVIVKDFRIAISASVKLISKLLSAWL